MPGRTQELGGGLAELRVVIDYEYVHNAPCVWTPMSRNPMLPSLSDLQLNASPTLYFGRRTRLGRCRLTWHGARLMRYIAGKMRALWHRHPVVFVIVLALLLRLVWLQIAFLGLPFQVSLHRFPHVSAAGHGYFHTPVQALDMWARWDALFYLNIAESGYAEPPDNLRVAFFPLYPACIAALAALTHTAPLGCALALGNVADVAGWLLVAALARLRLGPERALWAVLAFVLFPTRNFGFSAYSEGIFLGLSSAAFLFYERGQVKRAAGVCAIVSAARPQGVFVGFALLVEALWARYRGKKDAPSCGATALLLLSPLGLVSYMAYLQAQFGRPLYFLQVQNVWRRALTLPVNAFFANGEPHNHLALWFGVAVFTSMCLWRRPVRDLFYVGLSLLLPMSTGSVMSMARFVGVLFPLFLHVAWTLPAARGRRAYALVTAVYIVIFAFKIGQGAKVT